MSVSTNPGFRTPRHTWAGLLAAALLAAGGSALAAAGGATAVADAPATPDTEQAADETTTQAPPKPDDRLVTTAASLTQAMESDSGVSIQNLCTNCNNADLSVGGMGNEHVDVICDGLEVPPGLAQIYLLAVMPATVIDKVDVEKGAGDPRLSGSAVGGAIEIERRVPPEGLALNLSSDMGGWGWRGTRVDLGGRAGRFGGSLVGSWATSDRVEPLDDDEPVTPGGPRNRYPSLPEFDRYTVDASAFVDFSRNHRLHAGFKSYRESQEYGPAAFDFLSSTPERAVYNLENVEVDRTQYEARYEGYLGGGSRLTVVAAWSDRSQDIEETEFRGFEFSPTYFIDEARRNGSAAWSRPLGTRATIRAGVSVDRGEYDIVDVSFNRFSSSVPPDELFTFALSETVTESGVWVEAETQIGSKLSLSGGLRYVDFSYEDTEDRPAWLAFGLPEGNRLVPRAALVWKPVDVLQLRVSAGGGFRAPDPIYEEVCCGRRYRNNRGIRTERSRSFGVEAIFQPEPRFKLSGSAFVTDFDDRVIKLATLAFQYRPTIQNTNVPESRQTGIALESRFDATKWMSIKASLSWTDAKNSSPDEAIPTLIDFFGTPVEKTFFAEKIPYIAERRGALGLQFRPPRGGLDFGIAAQYTGPMRIQYFDPTKPDFSVGGSEVQPDLRATEDFWVVGVNFSKEFDKGVSLFAGVDNINDYVQSDLGDPVTDYNWGPLRGRYFYGGLRYRFARR